MKFFRIVLLALMSFSGFVLAAEASAPLVIMPMGDSITVGVDYYTNTAGGYRDPLLQDLNAAGISFTFAGAATGDATSALTAAGQTHHNGFGSWHIQDLDNNLDGVAAPISGGDSNQGGYLLTGGHGTGRSAVSPDFILLHIGTNDLLQGTPNINQNLYSLVTHIHNLCPNTVILIAGIIPINSNGFISAVQSYNSYIQNSLVPALPYTMYVDQNTGFLNDDGSVDADLLGTDNIHPDRFGYPILAYNWVTAIQGLVGRSGTTYGLTVSGGKGTGSYPAGSILTIRGNAAASGSQFASWTPSTTALTNPYSAVTTYVMPASTSSLTANYAGSGSPLIPNGTYEISSLYDSLAIAAAGAGDGSTGQQQTYTGASGQNWSVNNLGGNVVTLMLAGTQEALEVPLSSEGTVAANLDIATYTGGTNQQWTVTASEGATQLVNVGSGMAVNINGYATNSGAALVQYTTGATSTEFWRFYPVGITASLVPTSYTLTVNNGSGSGSYAAGTTVAVSANAAPQNYQFCGWTGATGGLASVSSASTTLTMPAASTVISANYCAVPVTYTLTVSSGSGSGSYTAGTTVAVSANAAPANYQFCGWTGATSALASTSSATTTVTMPAASIVIAANYCAVPVTYPLTVNGGTGSGVFAAGSIVPVSANAAPSGSVFAGWTGAISALASPSSATTTLTMPAAAATITATYAAAVTAPAPPSSSTGQVISVQFPQYYTHVLVNSMGKYNSTGGVVPVQNWNIADDDTGTSPVVVAAGGLVDSTGAGTTLGFTYSGYTANDGSDNHAFPASVNQTGGLGDTFLAQGTNFNTTGAPESLVLSGLDPTHTYNVIAYVTAPWWENNGSDVASVSAAGTSFYIQTSNTLATWIQATSTNAAAPGTGNYVQFTNLTGATTQAITVSGAYVGLAGFQVIDGGVAATTAPATYTLTVANGTGSGSYAAGTVVTVTANAAPSGSQFAGWTGATSALASPSSATTTLTMPAATTTITATYIAIPVTSSSNTVISVQFPQYYTHVVITPMSKNNYTGGVVPVQNWNVVDTDTGTNPATVAAGTLMDSTGATTTLGVTYSGYTRNDGTNDRSFPAAMWYKAGGLADIYLAQGTSFNSTGAPESLVLSGLDPTHTYSVIVYVTTPWWANGATGSEPASVVAGGTSYYIQTSNMLGSWTQASSTVAASPSTGNYVKFTGLTGAASQTITITGAYVGLAGFQVLDGGATH